MQEFTGLQYLYIDIANCFGLDKENWDVRLAWVTDNINVLEDLAQEADNPLLFTKAVNALRDTQQGIPSGHVMGMDATASGLQIMACLIGCHTTAENVNLINTGSREDVYQSIATKMDKLCTTEITRSLVKQPIMTTMYGSVQQPKNVFGEDTAELAAFYKVLQEELPGALEVLQDIQSCWQPYALNHTFHLPDGHTAKINVMTAIDKKIEVDELNHATFTHRAYINQGTATGISLAANIVHAVDGYIVREMVRKAHVQGFALLTIHDNFLASPNHMNKVRQNYIDILASIASMDLLQDILREVTGSSTLIYAKRSTTLSTSILNSEYALS